MKTSEYSNLDQIERDHWYYAGKRDIVNYWMQRCRPLQPAEILLDFGAGTGLFASSFLGRCKVLCYDSYPQSLEILRKRLPQECVLEPVGEKIPVADTSIDYVTALDVLEHIRDDSSVVEEFHRVLRPGGLAVITVPADMKLWSDWDVSLYHHRRYDRKSLQSLFVPAEWELIRVAHHNTLAYPIVFMLRKWRKWTKRAGESGDRAEDQLPSPLINRILRFLYTVPAKTAWFPAPFGVSLLMVAKKR